MMFTPPISKMGHFQHFETEMRKSANAQGTEGKGWGEKKMVNAHQNSQELDALKDRRG